MASASSDARQEVGRTIFASRASTRGVWELRRLLDGQGAFLGGAGGVQVTQQPLDDAEVAQGFGDLGVVGPVGRLLDGQGAFLEEI